jgi:transposase
MTQQDRDRLVVLKKAQRKLITQKQAATELDLGERQIRRLLKRLGRHGDKAVIHALRGRPSNRKLSEEVRQQVVARLSLPEWKGFGPTLASYHLAKDHALRIGREALRQIMTQAGLWRAKKQKIKDVHVWRPRRSCRGELVQWDTSEHDWLEGRSDEKLYLISMIDDATSELLAHFVRGDSTPGEHASVADVPGTQRQARGVLHRQGEPVPHCAESTARRKGVAKRRAKGTATDADRPGATGTTNRLDSRAQSPGERTRRTQFRHGTRPAGQRYEAGWDNYVGASQSISRAGVPAVVEPESHRRAGERGRRAPTARSGARSAVGVE